MQKKITTVLFIGNDDQEPRSFQIPTYLFKKYKVLISGFSAFMVVAFILAALSFYSFLSERNKNSELTGKITDMQTDLQLMDSMQIKAKVNSIESRLDQINDFLEERGVAIDSSVGGEVSDSLRIDPSIYEYMDTHTFNIFQDLRTIPVGFPFIGEISSGYGNRRNPFGGRGGEFHSGIDFKGETGSPIVATADGEVINATWKGGYGICVVLDHGNGYNSLFGHLSGTNVAQGQKVKAGDVIGFLGSTGRSTGPHVHYEIRKDGVDIDPVDYLYLN